MPTLETMLRDALEAKRLLTDLHEAWSDYNREGYVYTPDEMVMLILREMACRSAAQVSSNRASYPRHKPLTSEHAQRMRLAVEQASDRNLGLIWLDLGAGCSKSGIPFDLMAGACGYPRVPTSRSSMIACIAAVEQWSGLDDAERHRASSSYLCE